MHTVCVHVHCSCSIVANEKEEAGVKDLERKVLRVSGCSRKSGGVRREGKEMREEVRRNGEWTRCERLSIVVNIDKYFVVLCRSHLEVVKWNPRRV